MFSSKDLFFTPAVSTGYTVSKSLRFRSSASAYLSKTFASNGNRTVWTFSCWVKRGRLGVRQEILAADVDGTDNASAIFFDTSDRLNVQNYLSSDFKTRKITNAVFRDPSAWYHIVVSQNGSTACIVYVNSISQTFSTNTGPDASNWYINSTTPQSIGADSFTSSNYFDGYLAEVNFIGGSALTPSSFGAYDTNGVWQPAAYTGSYSGTNSFYLKFTTVGATSGSNTGYGQDFSGNGNYWTTNNFGTTSTATTYDSMIDSPTNYADGGNGRGNYATINPLRNYTGLGLSAVKDGNLTNSSGLGYQIGTTIPFTYKTYFEVYVTSTDTNTNIGFMPITQPFGGGYTFNETTGFTLRQNGACYSGTSVSATYGSWSATNIIGVAIDPSNGKIWYSINGTWQNSGDPAAGTGNVLTASSSVTYEAIINANTGSLSVNFGQRPFAYTPPSGFSALNTQNLTTPTIANGASYMAAVTYTGTGSSQTITASSTNSGNNPLGTTFQPDWVWVKGRSGATDHALYDAVRGVQLQLESNTTTAETTETTGLTAFTSSGFTTGALAQMNTNTATYVAWEWNAGGSTVTNTSGSISAQVRANTSAGFSVVTFTAPATNTFTVGHGLGPATPSMIIVKGRNQAYNWIVYHSSIGAGNYLWLNSANASAASTLPWANTAPTSSVFSSSGNGTYYNNGDTLVGYCFAPVAGYSAFGSYTGNGSTDGPFIYTGFRPRWVLYKSSSGAYSWTILDTSRDTYNIASAYLQPNTSNAEASAGIIDITSNGFKVRNSDVSVNASGGTFIYAAFAENPFKVSRAR